MGNTVIADMAVVVWPDISVMDWLRVVCCLALYGVLSLAGLARWYRNLVRARLIEDTPTSRTRSAAQGYVELVGHQHPAPGHTTNAPLTGTPCTWWHYTVEQRKIDYLDGSSRWVMLEEATSTDPILLKDGKGHMLVDPKGAEVMPTTSDRWYDDRGSPPRPMRVLKRRGGRFRYTEKRMHAGDRMYVSGELYSPSSRRSSIGFDVAFSDLLDRWKRDQPELLRRFDADGDGHIDSDEWDTARQAAHDETAVRLHSHRRASSIDIVRKPGDGAPFLLASKPQTELADKYRMFARNNLLLFLISGGITLYLFYKVFIRP